MFETMMYYVLAVCYIDNRLFLDVHYVCSINIMFVQHFEPQSRHFRNFHYYYYIGLNKNLFQYRIKIERNIITHTHARMHTHTQGYHIYLSQKVQL